MSDFLIFISCNFFDAGMSGVQQYMGMGAGEERIPGNVHGVQGRHP